MRPELQTLIKEARRLEALSMRIYVNLAQTFADDRDLHEFWMSMARHEAGHVGALELLEAMIEAADAEPDIHHTAEATAAAATAIEQLRRAAQGELTVERAFELAVELESTELEELVLDLIHSLADREQRDQAVQMVVHDLSDLSLMIEKYTDNDDLLARADALVEKHIDRRDQRSAERSGGDTPGR